MTEHIPSKELCEHGTPKRMQCPLCPGGSMHKRTETPSLKTSNDLMANPVAAKRSAAKFLLERFEKARCDSDGVSDCVRCNTVALARWMLQDIERAAPETPQPASNEEVILTIAELNQFREVWRAALTLANNLCVQESDRINADDGSMEAMDALGEAAKRIRGWIEPDDSQLLEMLREANALPTRASDETSATPVCDGEVRVIYKNGEPDGVRDASGYLCHFNRVPKYAGQDERYRQELALRARQADVIATALRGAQETGDGLTYMVTIEPHTDRIKMDGRLWMIETVRAALEAYRRPPSETGVAPVDISAEITELRDIGRLLPAQAIIDLADRLVAKIRPELKDVDITSIAERMNDPAVAKKLFDVVRTGNALSKLTPEQLVEKAQKEIQGLTHHEELILLEMCWRIDPKWHERDSSENGGKSP